MLGCFRVVVKLNLGIIDICYMVFLSRNIVYLIYSNYILSSNETYSFLQVIYKHFKVFCCYYGWIFFPFIFFNQLVLVIYHQIESPHPFKYMKFF